LSKKVESPYAKHNALSPIVGYTDSIDTKVLIFSLITLFIEI